MRRQSDDMIVRTLKRRYFDLLTKERIPNTPQITEEADNLEAAIKELQQRKDETK